MVVIALKFQSSNQIKRKYVWQSRVEIENYSIAYFDHVTAFEAL